MLRYPVTFHDDTNETVLVRFPDLPFTNSVAQGLGDAIGQVQDALEVGMSLYINRREPVPLPSAAFGDGYAHASTLASMKVLLWNEMLAQGLTKAELGRRMEAKPTVLDRIFDLGHGTRMENLERAAKVLGKRINVTLG